jgi:hypothetical protein
MQIWRLAGIFVAVAMVAMSWVYFNTPSRAPSNKAADPEVIAALPASSEVAISGAAISEAAASEAAASEVATSEVATSEVATSEISTSDVTTPGGFSAHVPSLPLKEDASSDTKATDDLPVTKSAKLETQLPVQDHPPEPPPNSGLNYVAYYVYSELPPERKPADIVLDSLKDVPVGTPVEEIKRAADAFGLDFSFMRAVAKIESDFDPKQRTGSYVGLFQLNNYEFKKYGSGSIISARDNAIAAAYKFVTEATLFEMDTHKKPTFSDLYLIHQQGWQGAAEHVAHPERIAWMSMCATDEGREKGERWCKRAIWGNTLPDIKKAWKSVDKLTSSAFVTMWRERVDHLYARYSEATAGETKH